MATYALRYRELSAAELAEGTDTRYSALYCLIVIGEALNEIPPAVKSLALDIRWRDIIDMRNILVHAYWRVDYTIVHGVLTRDLETFIEAVDRLLVVVERNENHSGSKSAVSDRARHARCRA